MADDVPGGRPRDEKSIPTTKGTAGPPQQRTEEAAMNMAMEPDRLPLEVLQARQASMSTTRRGPAIPESGGALENLPDVVPDVPLTEAEDPPADEEGDRRTLSSEA